MFDLYRDLGRTGVRVSPLTLGCMNFGGRTGLAESCAIIDRALEGGINFLDTANVYGNGASEEVVGEALARNGHRDFVYLATKCHGNLFKPADGDDAATTLRKKLNPNRWGNSRRMIIDSCEASLRRLRTDRIDLYQIHRPHPGCAIDETLGALDDLVRQGKVRSVGCSTFAAYQLVASLWTSEKLGLNRFVTEQPPYHLLDRRIERELLPACAQFGLGVIPWSPLAGGFLTGKYRSGAGGDARLTPAGGERNRKLLSDPRAAAAVEKLCGLAEAKGCSPSQLALAWVMHQPGITSPIIGPRTMEQLDDNLGAAGVEVTEDDRLAMDELVPPGTCIVPYYEAAWEAPPRGAG
ncbi:aldo/keto reductase [Phycisphaera mikurensis]|uniref:Putative aldo/keto reductase n=1 Tax=Phycisphaera mikurensis (strain NBRC 102666 / KCTC 22515 / FYK2301M01) TaxID=1142394 RepID=I0IBH5_PHYMF|nr:aldo/keto reductase [Phycisphaera mikurensis]MBB6442855.1 aryl-alcohol dehydrogenase-like predicted oxidoreductase [Phycisphaera mikurensis]BAM02613.1 putative aldo/keto reductase [Phycisphaera mikurensis NBRC 102666]